MTSPPALPAALRGLRSRAALLGPLALTALSLACKQDPRPGPAPGQHLAALGDLPPCPAAPSASTPPVQDPLPPSRVLRRIHLALTGKPPTDSDYDALAAAGEAGAQQALEQAAEKALGSAEFYDQMVDFGHQWLRNTAYTTGAQGDGYWGSMAANLSQCKADSKHPGAYYLPREDPKGANPCNDLDPQDQPTAPRVRQAEPWWAPGTQISLVGDASETGATITNDKGQQIDCGHGDAGYFNYVNAPGCGCGPGAAWCFPDTGLRYSGEASRHQESMWEEPARLVGHLAWHDRPLSDVIVGNYSVGNNHVQHWYLRFGRQTGLYNAKLDQNTSWFHPSDSAPRDPRHPDTSDRDAWREFVPEKLAPQLLSLSGGQPSNDLSRTLRWDPRTDPGPAPGLPVAGILTTAGFNSSFSRERPRAARALEIFTCRQFTPPPPEQHFSPVGDDLAKTGPCQQCHVAMDPVAMTFKRWNFSGAYVPLPRLVDLADLPVPADLFDPKKDYPYSDWLRTLGGYRWKMNWLPATTLTPATKEQIDSAPRTLFVDTIPDSYTLFGQHNDGTMGPLGFAKILLGSGEFDRCAAQRLYERIVGRKLDPAREPLFLQDLGLRFAQEGRKVRPFVRYLLTTNDFKRGF